MNEENNKNQLSKYLKKTIKKWAIRILVLTSIVLILLFLAFAALDIVGDKVQEVWSSVAKIFKVNLEEGEYSGKITIDDEQVDKIIESMKELGIDLDDLQLMGDDADYNNPKVQQENREALQKYVRKFYEAQATTETIYLKEKSLFNWKEILKDKDSYGTVFVYRVNGDADNGQTAISKDNPGTALNYMRYDKLEAKAKTGNISSVRDYYSINDKGQLVIPYWTITSVNKKTNVKISLKHINYKSAISQYTTSMNFFFYLAMVSRNPEFVSAVADLVRTGEIHITVLENKTVIDETEKYYATQNYIVGPRKELGVDGEEILTPARRTTYKFSL